MSESPTPSSSKAKEQDASNGLGRGLFADTNIKVGENVLHFETPFVAVLETVRLEDTCSGCFGKKQLATENELPTSLKACTGCQVVKYCDKTCQANDWRFAHSLECAIYRNLKPRVLPINARAILRMVLRIGAEKYTERDRGLFNMLGTHIQEIQSGNPAQWERITLTAKAVKEYSSTEIEEDMIIALGAKLDVNAFNLTNAVYDRIGLYLHPFAAIMNHNCNYNCVVGFDGPEIYAKAIRPIVSGEQIFISYIDVTNPLHIRTKELRERYFFECSCEKCSSESTATEHNNDTEEAKAVAKEAHALLSSNPVGGVHDNWKLSTTIQELITHSWPKTRQPFPSILDEMISADISTGEPGWGFLNASLRYLHIDKVVYPSDAHPLRAVHAWTLAKMAILLSQTDPGFTLPGFIAGRGAIGVLTAEAVKVDYGLIAWSVLVGLVAKKEDSCIVPGFKKKIERAFLEVHWEFMRNGLDPRGMGVEIGREWMKIRQVLKGYLKEIFGEKD
ncbi:hypothetical protein BJX99DRAFT_228972 [Aspergillus californicus]